jgi:hypothetical protein
MVAAVTLQEGDLLVYTAENRAAHVDKDWWLVDSVIQQPDSMLTVRLIAYTSQGEPIVHSFAPAELVLACPKHG